MLSFLCTITFSSAIPKNYSHFFLFHFFLFSNSRMTKRNRIVVPLSCQWGRITKEVGLWQSERQHPLKFSLLVGSRNTSDVFLKMIQNIKWLFKQYCSIIICWQVGATTVGPVRDSTISNTRLLSLEQKQQIEGHNGDTHEDYISNLYLMPTLLSSQQLSQCSLSEGMQRKEEACWILQPAPPTQYLGKKQWKLRNFCRCGPKLPLHWWLLPVLYFCHCNKVPEKISYREKPLVWVMLSELSAHH